MMRNAMLFGGCLLVLFGFAAELTATEHTKEMPAEVKKAVENDKATLLDVREKSEWDKGHLKHAKLLPLSTLQGDVKIEDLEKTLPKDKPVYLHCASGFRCLKAAEILKKHGYDVRPLKPGYRDLLKIGFPDAPR